MTLLNKIKIRFIAFIALIFFGLLIFIVLLSFFAKAIQQSAAYSLSKTHYRIFHHLKKPADEEEPFKIVSQFRGDSMKKGLAPSVFSLKGLVQPLFKNINGSLHGASKATPAVDETGIYIGSDNGWLYKLSHKGELVWKIFFAKAENGFHGTALLSKKYLWIGAYDGVLYCLKKKTGELIWSIDLGDAIGASPSFYKGQIVVSVELMYPRAMGYVAGVSAKDGSLKWKSPLTPLHIHSSVAIHNKKGYGVTGSNNDSLYKIDLNSGQILWSLKMKGDIKSTPLIQKDRIYVSNWGGQIAQVSEQGQIIWEKNIKGRFHGSPTYIPDKDYLITPRMRGELFALSAKTGKMIWKKKIANRKAMANGVSFFSKKWNKYLFLFPCQYRALCLIDPADGSILKSFPTGFFHTGDFGFFKKAFYINFNKGGVQTLN